MADRWYLIHNRAEFFAQLDNAIAKTNELQAREPALSMLAEFALQLDAMKRWTANGRKPTHDERNSISMGTRAQRELQETNDLEWYDYKDLITQLDDYFKYWLSDAGLKSFDWDSLEADMPDLYDFSDEP